jgi:hypothetical protein
MFQKYLFSIHLLSSSSDFQPISQILISNFLHYWYFNLVFASKLEMYNRIQNYPPNRNSVSDVQNLENIQISVFLVISTDFFIFLFFLFLHITFRIYSTEFLSVLFFFHRGCSFQFSSINSSNISIFLRWFYRMFSPIRPLKTRSDSEHSFTMIQGPSRAERFCEQISRVVEGIDPDWPQLVSGFEVPYIMIFYANRLIFVCESILLDRTNRRFAIAT